MNRYKELPIDEVAYLINQDMRATGRELCEFILELKEEVETLRNVAMLSKAFRASKLLIDAEHLDVALQKLDEARRG